MSMSMSMSDAFYNRSDLAAETSRSALAHPVSAEAP
jgi:hypothetical protein